jgi:hypothetical protein
VRLLRADLDSASVFEVIGPGSVHPQLTDLTVGATLTASGRVGLDPQDAADTPGSAPYSAGPGAVTYVWAAPAAVAQVSVGGAHSVDGVTGAAEVQLLESGRWVTVASAAHGVGDVRGGAPFVLVQAGGVTASGVRVVMAGSGRLAAIDLHVLGVPAAAATTSPAPPG